MNTSHPILAGKSSRAPSVAHILLWAWLVGLTALVLVAFQVTGDLAGQSQLDSSVQRLQALESRVAEIADTNRVLQERPAPATAAALQELRQTLDSRAAQLDQSLATRAAQEDLIALRADLEQIRVRQTAARSNATSKPRAVLQTTAKPVEVLMPFRVIGSELRAGQRTVSIAPASGDLSASQILVVLPGESVGPWRLEDIDRNTAVFRAGEQTRRLAIP
ncbi:hypothetical protein ACM7QE_02640 [Pseudomonas aeruginosa]|uniref:hypothetical protein n=1 Tax=Gammaproteobacteria TaxID=1236 RepID=UPI001CC1DCF2|nr:MULTISPECIES: hypothetical protein [Gammaproteobacteria]